MITNPVCTSRKQFVNKMTDSMKFGPEWLRNLSAEGSTTPSTGGGQRYQLAEHRYGREEMLALFEQSLKLRPPASMQNCKTIYAEQAMNPLALSPMTEDENRLWSGRTVPPGAPRGRGGSMDRGRGRGRGGSFHPGFNRSVSTYDEPMRPFDRTQADRGWSERNGGEMSDWTSGTSPRKEYGSSRGGGGGLNSDNWRRHRSDDPDADGWRTTTNRGSGVQEKWIPAGGTRPTSMSNWRDGDIRTEEHGHLSDRQANHRPMWHHSSGDNSKIPPQRRHWDIDDHLPEWATENPSESGGTFDASGAFHGSDEETEKSQSRSQQQRSDSRENSSNRETPGNNNNVLQKSASQHNITSAKKQPGLSTSQSATNLIKKLEDHGGKETTEKKREEKTAPITTKPPPIQKPDNTNQTEMKENHNTKTAKQPTIASVKKEEALIIETVVQKPQILNGINKQEPQPVLNKVEDEFDHHMKEVTDDIVAKLILDDELPKPGLLPPITTERPNVPVSSVIPPLQYPTGGGLASVLGSTATPTMPPPPGQDKWYYRDPQGEVQGPFTAQEMAEWLRAGYFTSSLLVRRLCDDRYFMLGDLVKQCGSIPFQTCRLPPLKNEPLPQSIPQPIKAPEIPDPLQLQQLHMQRIAQRHAEAIRTLSQTEPWGGLSNIQQREMVHQHLMSQPQVLSDLPFIPPVSNTQIGNPVMHLISQMQQANKMPTQATMVDKPPNNLTALDPLQQLVQQMGGMQSSMGQSIPTMGQQPQPPVPTPTNTQVLDPNSQPENPIQSLIRQLAHQPPQHDIWDLRNNQNQYTNQQQPSWLDSRCIPNPGLPPSMWDLQTPTPVIPPPIITPTSIAAMNQQQQQQQQQQVNQQTNDRLLNDLKEQDKLEEQKKKAAELEKEQKLKERKETAEKERKKKELEQLERLKAQKEAEEKRKEEQRRKEAEKKAESEKQRKEEERIRKELEKAKREAEEKRIKELEEKRKLKEQRKAAEEARQKAEEDRKKEEEEKQNNKREIEKQEQARRQAEALRKMQEQQQRTKVAPWCQASATASSPSATSLSLAEIQRIEREKRAEQAALLQQQQKAMAAAKEHQEQQVANEKSSIQLKWATTRPVKPKQIKSLAEIQAEEQERVAKQQAEARLAQQLKEKETSSVSVVNNASIWSSANQSLSWTTNNTSNTTHVSGFWDDSPPAVQKSPTKGHPPAAGILKSHTVSVMNTNTSSSHFLNSNSTNNKTASKPNKSRAKKDEQQVMKLFDKNGPSHDEFTAWCNKTLATIDSEIELDIPTFVSFLRDVESPYEVKDYVRQYFGDGTQALHFANQFVERRSRVKDMQRAAMQHKDDLCQPAPAITPSNEFQEVKGKGKKTKKSKMLRVDARILGFSVTAAEDRINVGDRDYGDNL